MIEHGEQHLMRPRTRPFIEAGAADSCLALDLPPVQVVDSDPGG